MGQDNVLIELVRECCNNAIANGYNVDEMEVGELACDLADCSSALEDYTIDEIYKAVVKYRYDKFSKDI